MTVLLQHLKEFNRKERFYLIGMTLGNHTFHLKWRSGTGFEML